MTDIYPFTINKKRMNTKHEMLAHIQHELLTLESKANSLKNERDKVLDLCRKKRAQALQLHEEINADEQQQKLDLE